MSVRSVATRIAAALTFSLLAACAADAPTAPQKRLTPTAAAKDLCPNGYSVAEGRC